MNDLSPKKAQIQKVYWDDVRGLVQALNPEFARLLDEYAFGKGCYFYKAIYPYGALVLNQSRLMLPNDVGEIVPITDPTLNKEVGKDLAYNEKSLPVGMVLANSFEIFYPRKESTISDKGLLKPGKVFGAENSLHPKKRGSPLFLWDMTAGARSIFMLPKIAEEKKHYQLQKAFNIESAPQSLIQQWSMFKDLANHPNFLEDWNAEVLFFPQHWFAHFNDCGWSKFYLYFYRMVWASMEFERSQSVWNLIYSLILEESQDCFSSQIANTVKYLIHIGMGGRPGFAPAMDDIAAPIRRIQDIYYEVYGLKKYPAVLMVPTFFEAQQSNLPVYYSLQFPIATEFSRSNHGRNSLVDDLERIGALILKCESALLPKGYDLDNSLLMDLFTRVDFKCFHTLKDVRNHVRNSVEIAEEDLRFARTLTHASFPENLSQKIAFTNACVRISARN